MAAHHLEPLDLLGRERILVEEQTVLLQLLSQMDRVDGIEMLMHIVAEIDAKAEAVAPKVHQILARLFDKSASGRVQAGEPQGVIIRLIPAVLTV